MALESNILGIVHPALFPGPGNTCSVMRGEGRDAYVLKSIQWIINDPDFQSLEITRIKSSSIRREVSTLLNQAKQNHSLREIVYTAQLVQLINEDNLIDPSDICSLDENERIKAVLRLQECIDEACEFPCDKFAFYSGKDPAILQGLSGDAAERVREEALTQLRRSVHEICLYIKEKTVPNRPPLLPVLEIFDSRANIPGTNFSRKP